MDLEGWFGVPRDRFIWDNLIQPTREKESQLIPILLGGLPDDLSSKTIEKYMEEK